MKITEAIDRAEQLLNSAQATMDTLKTSAE